MAAVATVEARTERSVDSVGAIKYQRIIHFESKGTDKCDEGTLIQTPLTEKVFGGVSIQVISMDKYR